jgi:hypothetical protein
LHLLVFHAYINEVHGSRRKILSKNLITQRYAEGFNSGVKELIRKTIRPCLQNLRHLLTVTELRCISFSLRRRVEQVDLNAPCKTGVFLSI